GLVIATDHEAARAYAKMLRAVTGQGATIVLSDDPTASKKIKTFSETEDRWMVAVRMVSEGVDIPRLAVGVYATSTSTPLFFAQAIGRFVRARRRGETASVFLPSVPTLMGHAAEMETERDHVLDRPVREDGLDDDLLAEANRKRDTPDVGEELPFESVEASATFDRVLYDGGEFGVQAAPGSAEEQEYLGIP
ncbi:DEAD/DEAH box helicase, partial [Actinomadura adrarensis]